MVLTQTRSSEGSFLKPDLHSQRNDPRVLMQSAFDGHGLRSRKYSHSFTSSQFRFWLIIKPAGQTQTYPPGLFLQIWSGPQLASRLAHSSISILGFSGNNQYINYNFIFDIYQCIDCHQVLKHIQQHTTENFDSGKLHLYWCTFDYEHMDCWSRIHSGLFA